MVSKYMGFSQKVTYKERNDFFFTFEKIEEKEKLISKNYMNKTKIYVLTCFI